MQIRITKPRLAGGAALFVLAGVGLASVLSPLVGSALATVGNVVNISDHSSSAYFATVDKTGALKTAGTVSGSVAIGAPQSAFNFPALSFTDGTATAQFTATSASVAFTGFRIANGTPASFNLDMYQYPETSTTCSTVTFIGRRFLGRFFAHAEETVDEQRTTPLVLKPLPGKPYWCLVTFADIAGGGIGFYTTYSGYVTSGSFTVPTPSAPQSGRLTRDAAG